jgi:hypothetical protein
MNFTSLSQTTQRVKNLLANRPLERFESSQIYPWFAQKALERAQAMQCGPRGLGRHGRPKSGDLAGGLGRGSG